MARTEIATFRNAGGVALVFCVCCFGGAQQGSAAEKGCVKADAELPLVIPHPQAMRRAGNESIVLGDHGRVVAQIVLAERRGFFVQAENLIESALSKMGFSDKSDSTLTTVVITDRTRLATEESGVQPKALALTPAEHSVLDKSDQAYVIRMKPGKPSVIWIVGASPMGAYYGSTTIVQLVEMAAPARAVVGNVEVLDYPDMPYRMCADWVLNADWDVNAYDWGDGLDAFITRSKRKIDMCSRYKVNMVRFLGGRIAPGPDYMVERYPMIKRFALELNRYARRKGVALQYSTVSWGRDYCGAGVVAPQPWILNREQYPDGKVYACIGGEVGSCLSNDALTRIITNRANRLVQDLEPGSIYLHHVDVASYAGLVTCWKKRCQRCRQRFPDDEPFGAQGLAAAVAHLYNTIVTELKSVRNPSSGYDASRDLRIVFASPGYSDAGEDDVAWEKEIEYFQELGRRVKDKENVHITFREIFKRFDNRGLRTEEMTRCLADVGWPHAVFMFAIQGGGFWVDDRMLVSSPVLTETYRGANVIYNFNGHVHSEVQVLANVNYAWNHHAPGWVDPIPFEGGALLAEASRYATGSEHSDYLYGRFLPVACTRLYGESAAPYIADMFRLEKESGAIRSVLAGLQKRWKNAQYNWTAQADRNRQAKAFVDKALAVCDTAAKEDLERLSRCLEVGARFCDFCRVIHHEQLSGTDAGEKAIELLAWLDENFQFQKTEPDGGDPSIWKRLIAQAQQHHAEVCRRRVLTEDGHITVKASSALGGYAPLSVLISNRTGKGWGQDGGWNDATPREFPDTLEILFKNPRHVKRIDVYTLADNWRELEAVDADTRFERLGVTDVDVELRDLDDEWTEFKQIRNNRNVMLPLPDMNRRITGIRFRVLGTACGVWSRIVHVDLGPKNKSFSVDE